MDVAAGKPEGEAAMSAILAPRALTNIQMMMNPLMKTALGVTKVAEMDAASDEEPMGQVAADYLGC